MSEGKVDVLIGDVERGGEVVAAGVRATIDGSYQGPRITLVLPKGVARVDAAYQFKVPGRTILLHVDRAPISIVGHTRVRGRTSC